MDPRGENVSLTGLNYNLSFVKHALNVIEAKENHEDNQCFDSLPLFHLFISILSV